MGNGSYEVSPLPRFQHGQRIGHGEVVTDRRRHSRVAALQRQNLAPVAYRRNVAVVSVEVVGELESLGHVGNVEANWAGRGFEGLEDFEGGGEAVNSDQPLSALGIETHAIVPLAVAARRYVETPQFVIEHEGRRRTWSRKKIPGAGIAATVVNVGNGLDCTVP